jgi:hypothetical protein
MFITPRRALATLQTAALFAAFLATATVATPAHAQKKLDWEYTGSVSSTLVAWPHLIPDVYSFQGVAGETYVFHTTDTDLDTTIRVVAPNARTEIFNDDRNSSDLTSHIEFTAWNDGTYIVIVSNYAGSSTAGDYHLSFERKACDPATEPCVLAAPSEQEHKKHPQNARDFDRARRHAHGSASTSSGLCRRSLRVWQT